MKFILDNIVQKIIDTCKEKGVKQSYLNSLIGGYRGKFTDLKNGKTSLTDNEIKIIAKALNVSNNYLLGNETKNRFPAEAKSLSDIENEILEIYNTLPKDKKQAFLTVARSLKSQSADK